MEFMEIKEAYESGQSIVSVECNKNNIYRLHRLRKKTGCNATSKEVGDQFEVIAPGGSKGYEILEVT